ncbi:FliH/SctL family protein [Dyella koreensis]|uniref:Flagellar assembly protein FliH n=1 Tax=Dyella koreensis TaxID=311235 RepID=A0ABW8K8T8_9GAMM
MKAYRRYAFPPLMRLQAGIHEPVAVQAEDPALTEALLEECRKGGYDEGYAAGRTEGSRRMADGVAREARAALDALGEPFEAMRTGFARLQDAYRGELREQMVELVEEVARQVVRAELNTRPEQWIALVDEALATLPKPSETVEVRLHPAEYARVLEAVPEQVARYGFAPDPQLAPGECRVSAGERELDVGCGQRLAACMERVHALLHATTQGEA